MGFVFLTGLGVVLAPVGPASRPATRPAGKTVPFQPGIQVDWGRRQIEIDSTVVLREGLLELFACSPGTREHESILRVNCRPLYIYQALRLIGLTPGTPPAWDEKANKPIPPTGDRVDAFVRYRTGGKTKQVRAWDWMTGGEKALCPRSWVFAGAFRTEDGGLAADGEGTVLTVVDFADALLALAESHSADNAQLWVAARTEQIPALGTSCTLVLRPARTVVRRITLDRLGRLTLVGKTVSQTQLREFLMADLEADREPLIELRVEGDVASSSLERTVVWLKEIGIGPEAICVKRNGPEAGGGRREP